MKDKLRELAKDLAEKEKGNAPFERRFSEELLAILDAEGDGGAVPSAYMVSDNGWNQCFTTLDQCRMYGHEIIPLYTHPAQPDVVSEPPQPVRSVSDEDVDSCARVMDEVFHAADSDSMYEGFNNLSEEDKCLARRGVRAGLEHFVAIAQEKQS